MKMSAASETFIVPSPVAPSPTDTLWSSVTVPPLTLNVPVPALPTNSVLLPALMWNVPAEMLNTPVSLAPCPIAQSAANVSDPPLWLR